MARYKQSKALKNLREFRNELGLNQQQFWSMFGVTQSGGSRYENARGVPDPIQMLVVLFEQGALTAEQLLAARATANASVS